MNNANPERRAALIAAAVADGYTRVQAEEALEELGHLSNPDELLEWLEENYPLQ